MSSQPPQPSASQQPDRSAIGSLYRQLLDSWNRRSAADFAALFAEDGHVVGFDGSQMHGPAEIESQLGQIFGNHPTAAYMSTIREIRFLTADAALLRAAVGMLPPGQDDINPAVNAFQSLVATKQAGAWKIALLQNTPAAFHGRPDLAQQLTDELRRLLPHRAGSEDAP